MTVRRRSESLDVIHAHNYHAFPFLFGAFAATGATLVATPHYHGRSAWPIRDRLLSLYRPLGRRALRKADAVVAVSEWERRSLARDFGCEPTVVRNGLDVDRFAGVVPERRDRPYLLAVDRLERYKRIDLAVRALAERPAYDLLIVGHGPDGRRLKQLAEAEGVGDRVELLGYVDEERLPRLYAGASVHLTLSEHEAYGLTVVESLAAGTPCVVRETGALSGWADRSDCVAAAASSRAVGDAIDAAVGVDAPATPLRSRDDCVEELNDVYDRATTS